MIDQHDKLEKRCPMLGHPIHFHYCRTTTKDTPCRKIMDCWFEQIPIQEFVKEHFTEEMITAMEQPPKPKMLSLIELIEKAKKSQE